jgi:predicted phosphodiesterase
MRVAVLSDIHSNSWAFKAVVNDAKRNRSVDAFWFLGDLIGYGPDPLGCIKLAQSTFNNQPWIIGNHDDIALRVLELRERGIIRNWDQVKNERKSLINSHIRGVSTLAIDSITKNMRILESMDDIKWYKDESNKSEHYGPLRKEHDAIRFILVHASVAHPLKHYVFGYEKLELKTAFIKPALSEGRNYEGLIVILYGHTHIPVYCPFKKRNRLSDVVDQEFSYDEALPLGPRGTIINPGSVGSPRDLDSRASYAIVDTISREVIFRRVEYNLRDVERALKSGKYDNELLERLCLAPIAQQNMPTWYKERLERRASST